MKLYGIVVPVTLAVKYQIAAESYVHTCLIIAVSLGVRGRTLLREIRSPMCR